jgi:hypothetical protein
MGAGIWLRNFFIARRQAPSWMIGACTIITT